MCERVSVRGGRNAGGLWKTRTGGEDETASVGAGPVARRRDVRSCPGRRGAIAAPPGGRVGSSGGAAGSGTTPPAALRGFRCHRWSRPAARQGAADCSAGRSVGHGRVGGERGRAGARVWRRGRRRGPRGGKGAEQERAVRAPRALDRYLGAAGGAVALRRLPYVAHRAAVAVPGTNSEVSAVRPGSSVGRAADF